MVNDRILSTLHSSVRIYHTLNIQTPCHVRTDFKIDEPFCSADGSDVLKTHH